MFDAFLFSAFDVSGRTFCLAVCGSRAPSALPRDLARKRKALLCRDHGDNLIDDGSCCYRSLDHAGEFRLCNACKDERDAGVGKEREPQVLLDGLRHVGCHCAEAGAKVLAGGPRCDVDEGVKAGAENPVHIKRRAEVHDAGKKGKAKDRAEPGDELGEALFLPDMFENTAEKETPISM